MSDRFKRWSREQLENDIRRLWKVEICLKKEIEHLNKVLMDHHICPDCGTVNKICDCPFG